MGWVGEDAGQGGKVGDAHYARDTGVVAKAVGGNDGTNDGGEGGPVDVAGRDTVMNEVGGVCVRVVVVGEATHRLEDVLKAV